MKSITMRWQPKPSYRLLIEDVSQLTVVLSVSKLYLGTDHDGVSCIVSLPVLPALSDLCIICKLVKSVPEISGVFRQIRLLLFKTILGKMCPEWFHPGSWCAYVFLSRFSRDMLCCGTLSKSIILSLFEISIPSISGPRSDGIINDDLFLTCTSTWPMKQIQPLIKQYYLEWLTICTVSRLFEFDSQPISFAKPRARTNISEPKLTNTSQIRVTYRIRMWIRRYSRAIRSVSTTF